MKAVTFAAASEEDTDKLGDWLIQHLPTSCTVCLTGTLGAGKTRLVKAMAAACGIPMSDVVSPTFVLCQHYHGTRTLHHFDIYRLNDEDEFLELGCDEYFESEAITLVEWGERMERCLPQDRVNVRIELGDDVRTFHLEIVGDVDLDLSRLV